MGLVTKDMRFAMDEKGLKSLTPTLIGQTISYWDTGRRLKHGVVKAADLARDNYGSPFIRVQIEEQTSGSDHGVVVQETGAPAGHPSL